MNAFFLIAVLACFLFLIYHPLSYVFSKCIHAAHYLAFKHGAFYSFMAALAAIFDMVLIVYGWVYGRSQWVLLSDSTMTVLRNHKPVNIGGVAGILKLGSTNSSISGEVLLFVSAVLLLVGVLLGRRWMAIPYIILKMVTIITQITTFCVHFDPLHMGFLRTPLENTLLSLAMLAFEIRMLLYTLSFYDYEYEEDNLKIPEREVTNEDIQDHRASLLTTIEDLENDQKSQIKSVSYQDNLPSLLQSTTTVGRRNSADNDESKRVNERLDKISKDIHKIKKSLTVKVDKKSKKNTSQPSTDNTSHSMVITMDTDRSGVSSARVSNQIGRADDDQTDVGSEQRASHISRRSTRRLSFNDDDRSKAPTRNSTRGSTQTYSLSSYDNIPSKDTNSSAYDRRGSNVTKTDSDSLRDEGETERSFSTPRTRNSTLRSSSSWDSSSKSKLGGISKVYSAAPSIYKSPFKDTTSSEPIRSVSEYTSNAGDKYTDESTSTVRRMSKKSSSLRSTTLNDDDDKHSSRRSSLRSTTLNDDDDKHSSRRSSLRSTTLNDDDDKHSSRRSSLRSTTLNDDDDKHSSRRSSLRSTTLNDDDDKQSRRRSSLRSTTLNDDDDKHSRRKSTRRSTTLNDDDEHSRRKSTRRSTKTSNDNDGDRRRSSSLVGRSGMLTPIAERSDRSTISDSSKPTKSDEHNRR